MSDKVVGDETLQEKKTCSQCKLDLSLDCFSPNGNRLRSNCKKCQAKKRKIFVSKNKDKVLKQNHLSYENNKDTILDKKKIYHIKNRDVILDNHKDYYLVNKETILAKVMAYRKKHPEVYRASNSKRRAQKRAAICNVSSEEIRMLKEEYNYCCAYCSSQTNENNPLHIDHMIPLSKGGQHIIENLLPACRDCNLKKFNMGWDEWCKKIGYDDGKDDSGNR